MSGKIIKSDEGNTTSTHHRVMNINDMPRGVYIVQVITEEGTMQQKIVK